MATSTAPSPMKDSARKRAAEIGHVGQKHLADDQADAEQRRPAQPRVRHLSAAASPAEAKASQAAE